MPRRKLDKPQPTQEAAREAVEEARKLAPTGALIVYADFDEFKAGDVFEIPEGWTRDDEYKELLLNKQKKREGVVFFKPDGSRVVLPLKDG